MYPWLTDGLLCCRIMALQNFLIIVFVCTFCLNLLHSVVLIPQVVRLSCVVSGFRDLQVSIYMSSDIRPGCCT